jgi:hypothetical protein
MKIARSKYVLKQNNEIIQSLLLTSMKKNSKIKELDNILKAK